jgi:hypothetical protein
MSRERRFTLGCEEAAAALRHVPLSIGEVGGESKLRF